MHLRALAVSLFVFLLLLSACANAKPGGIPSLPPDFPDTRHVPNGCYLSAVTYLEKFKAAYPTEHVRLQNFHPRGWPAAHMVALVTWQGAWFIRDEYFGVFSSSTKSGDEAEESRFVHEIVESFESFTLTYLKSHRLPSLPWDPRHLTAEQRAESVANAAKLLPFPSERYWVQEDKQAVPVLFFQPAPGQVAVYDPDRGTAAAGVRAKNVPAIVTAVAAQLGYHVTFVCPANPERRSMLATR